MTALALAACSPQSSPADETAAVKAADAALQEAVAAKNVAKVMVHYADEAVLLPAHRPIVSGKSAITQEWQQVLAVPDVENASTLSKAEVAASGDLAYTMGSYRARMTGEAGVLADQPGKWLSVWRKQADGQWRIVVETYNSDVPPPGRQ